MLVTITIHTGHNLKGYIKTYIDKPFDLCYIGYDLFYWEKPCWMR